MPDVICNKCGLSYRVKKVGVTVIEMAFQPPAPYNIKNGDLLECPGCHNQIVDGFGIPTYHHEDYFEAKIKEAENLKAVHPNWVIYVYERTDKLEAGLP